MDMGSLGNMLSAVPGGFQQGSIANNQIDQQQLQLADTRAKQVGMQAYFRALQGMLGPQQGQGPQPPMPGQPSMPQGPQMSPGAIPGGQMTPPPMAMSGGAPMQGADGGMMPPDMQRGGAPPMASAPAAMPQGGAPMGNGAGGGQQLTWQGIVQALKQQNPGASDLELAHAVDHFMPMMNQQMQLDWRNKRNELMAELGYLRADTVTRGQDVRADTTDRRTGVIADQEAGRQERFGTAEERRNRSLDQRDAQFKQREDRLERSLQLRNDSTWVRLDQQKQGLEQRIRAGDRRQAVIEWRAAVDAQHKLAMEKIMASNANSTMKPAERQKLIEDQNGWYRGEIEKLKNLTTQRGNLTDEGPETGRSVTELPPAKAPPTAPAAPATAAAPPAATAGAQALPAAFKEDADGTKYQKGGQTWVKQGDQLVLENGG